MSYVKSPTYLVRRESGIWQFQIRVPAHISPIPKVVRQGTRTTDYRTALKIARQCISEKQGTVAKAAQKSFDRQ